tara:strand:- start:385 stop:543 length:159 start_codon:yes stop_codon:yes gene_type:complete
VLAQAGDLTEEPKTFVNYIFMINCSVMQIADQSGQKGLAVSKINHHQWNGRK